MPAADYVIVGAGSAGCVLANRLSEDPGAQRAADRGGRPRPAPEHRDPGRVRQAVPHQARLGLRDRARAALRRPLAVPAARQGPGRLERDERDALRARAPARLRPLGRARLALGRRAAVLPQGRGQRARRLRAPRHRRPAAGRGRALAAAAHQALPRGRRGQRHPLHRRLQRPRAGRRGAVPGHPAQRPALEHQRRLPAPGPRPRQPRDRHRRDRAARRARRRARDRRRLPRPLRARARRRGRARGDPGRRRVRLAAAADAVRDRPGRAAARARASTSRSTRREVGENLQDHPFKTVVCEVEGGLARRRRAPALPGRVAAAPQRPADLHGRRGVRVRAQPARACRRPTCSSTSRPRTSSTTARRSSTATR